MCSILQLSFLSAVTFLLSQTPVRKAEGRCKSSRKKQENAQGLVEKWFQACIANWFAQAVYGCAWTNSSVLLTLSPWDRNINYPLVVTTQNDGGQRKPQRTPGIQEFTHHSQIQFLINLEIYNILLFYPNPRSWGCTQQQWWSEFPQWTSKPGPEHKCCIGFLFDMF